MNIVRVLGSAAFTLGTLLAGPTLALPTFQAYINGATAGTMGGDAQTWFHTGSSFDLSIVGAYGPNDIAIRSVTLLLSIPKGEQGTFTITSATDETPIHVSSAGGVTGSPLNPSSGADTDVLTDVTGMDGYGTKAFLPAGVTFNNHFPFQAGVSDFLLFDLSAFDMSEIGLNNYDASDGSITFSPQAEGEQKDYSVSFTGFSQLHIDAYGFVETSQGPHIATTWDISPGSHDSTAQAVPAPGAFVLGFLGLAVVGVWHGRRRTA